MCTLHNSIVLAICVLKTIEFGGDLTKFGQKQVGTSLLAHRVHIYIKHNMINITQ